jgi:cytochrome P450
VISQKGLAQLPMRALRGGAPISAPRQADARRRVPPGPAEEFATAQDLLLWMGENFDRYGDIFKARVFGTSVYAIRSPEYAQHVLRTNWQNYVKGQAIKRIALLLGNGLMVSEGEVWKTQRRMIQPAFHRSAIETLIDVIAASNANLLRNWRRAAQAGEAVNVTRDISLMVLEVVLKSIFGCDYEAAALQFGIVSDETARNLQFAQAFRALGKLVLQIVARRRNENVSGTDILGLLLQARDRESGEAMPDRQLVNEVLTLVVAGHETTASSLNWAWYLLSQHPAVEAKLSAELAATAGAAPLQFADLTKFAYTRQVLDEVMRLYPPGWLMTRKALSDDEFGGYIVPAGTEIYISPYFIQRHPALWDKPDQFDPDRFDPASLSDRHPLALLPFSAGPRNCIGEHLARMEMQIHLMIVAAELRLRYADEAPPELDAGVNLRSKHDFIMFPELKVGGSGRQALTMIAP